MRYKKMIKLYMARDICHFLNKTILMDEILFTQSFEQSK